MIPVTVFKGQKVALFGLGLSGIASAKALIAGGAEVLAWDDSADARKQAAGSGVHIADLSDLDIVCEFTQSEGGRKNEGYYQIIDWGAVKKSWIKKNLNNVCRVLDVEQK